MTGSSPSRLIWSRLAVLVAVAIALAGGRSAPARDEAPATTASATAPATSPLDLIAAATRPALEPIDRAETVREALDYSDDERTILADVRDGDGQLDTSALGVLLRRASMLPRDPVPLNEADRPNVRNFWLEPGGYRGKLLAADVGFVEYDDFTRRMAWTRWWGRRAVYIVTVSVPVGNELRSMIVMTPEEPPDDLKKGRRLRLAGLFYKLVRMAEQGREETEGPAGEYPVLVVRSMRPERAAVGEPPSGGGMPLALSLGFAAIVVLLLLFYMLRRKIARAPAGKPAYRPLRYQEVDGVRRPTPAADEPVDEELIRQVADYRKEHGLEEPPKDG